MILVTKTSDQTRLRGIRSLLVRFLLKPWVRCASLLASLLFSRLSGWAGTEPNLSCLRFFSFHPSLPRFPASRLQLLCGFLRFPSSPPPSPIPSSFPFPSPLLLSFPSLLPSPFPYCVPSFASTPVLLPAPSPPPSTFTSPPPFRFRSRCRLRSRPGLRSLLPVPRTRLPPRYDARVKTPGPANGAVGCSQAPPPVCRNGDACGVCVSWTLTDRASTITSNILGCQSGAWLQIGTQFNGSHHGDNLPLRQTGIQITTISLPGPTNRGHRKHIRVSAMS